jgi:Ni/Co efflux regulator RcnB
MNQPRQGGGWDRGGDQGRRDNDRGRDRDRNWNNGRDGRFEQNRNYRDNRWTDNRNRWDRGWRSDRNYNWQGYRNQYRDRFRIGAYYNPYGYNYGYNRFSIGFYIDSGFYSSRYWISDPYQYRLPAVYGPYRWIRYYDDVLLIDIRSGEVVDVIYNFFW